MYGRDVARREETPIPVTPEDSSRSATRVSLIAELNAELDILQYRDAPFVGSLVR